MAHLLGAEGLHLEYPTRIVFDSVTLGIEEGDRIGIVGRNGDGKSSLLGMLAGRREPDGGRVTVRGGTTIGVLDQADTLDDALTVGGAVVGDTPEHVWAGDAKVRDVIGGLVADLDWNASVADLSGGQRRRVALAALLTDDWDVIALDEPSERSADNRRWHEHTAEVPRNLADRSGVRDGRRCSVRACADVRVGIAPRRCLMQRKSRSAIATIRRAACCRGLGALPGTLKQNRGRRRDLRGITGSVSTGKVRSTW